MSQFPRLRGKILREWFYSTMVLDSGPYHFNLFHGRTRGWVEHMEAWGNPNASENEAFVEQIHFTTLLQDKC